MTIKAAGTPLKWSEIQTEFGPTPTSMSNMKQYRDIDPVGGITDLSLDENYSVQRFPTSGEVKFSDFYSKQLNIIVNYYDVLNEDWNLVYNAFSVSPVYRVRLVIATGVYTYTANNADVGTSTDTTLDLGSTRYIVGDEVTDTGDSKIFKIKIEQKGNARVDAKLKYDSGTIGQDFVVVGGMRGKPGTTEGCKVRIHVNQTIGSSKGDAEICALKTGNWSGDTVTSIDVGPNGKIYGAGGDGGEGTGGKGGGAPGKTGTSAIGVENVTPGFTYINVMNGGLVRGGYGGGGGGGTSEGYRKRGIRNRCIVYFMYGGGGGGGAGLPVGSGGAGAFRNYGCNYDCDDNEMTNGHPGCGTNSCCAKDGEPGTLTDGGDGGLSGDGNVPDAAYSKTDCKGQSGGDGGKGGYPGNPAESGESAGGGVGNCAGGTGGNGPGGLGGAQGAAVRKAASVNVVTVNTTGLWNDGAIGTTDGDTGASGVQ